MTVTEFSQNNDVAQRGLVLSLFPGIGLLDLGFEEMGFCVVRGPDLIWGGDVRKFNPPAGRFEGVIGGPPCQEFSQGSNGQAKTGYGVEMLGEFVRVVELARPMWWLMENVARVPDVRVDGYSWQRLDLWAHEFGLRQRRLRHFQFGSRDGTVLVMVRGRCRFAKGEADVSQERAAVITASDSSTPWTRFCTRTGFTL